MNKFVLKKHSVTAASFVEDNEREKINNIEVSVEGSILIPKDSDKDNSVIIKLKFHFGKEEERLFLTLEKVTIFGTKNSEIIEIDEENVKKECLPIALAQIRKTVKEVTEAYGRTGIDLPPFEEEIIN